MTRGLWLLLLVGCTEPSLIEVACTNGVDDDGDGEIDCLDLDCIEQDAVCETTLERCRDGRDNDRDEIADCHDPICIESGFCEPFVPEGGCDLREQTGCPIGMACWLGEEERECALAEPADRVPGQTCDETQPVSFGCRPGSGCVDGICSDYCLVEAQCPPDSRCSPLHPLCTIPCEPRQGDAACADPRSTCAPLQAFVPELEFARGGGLFSCVIADPEWGSAVVGERCSRAVRCEEGLVCAPDLDLRSSCRLPCSVSVSSGVSVGCPEETDVCWPTYPSHPAIEPGEPGLVQGTCWPEGAR